MGDTMRHVLYAAAAAAILSFAAAPALAQPTTGANPPGPSDTAKTPSTGAQPGSTSRTPPPDEAPADAAPAPPAPSASTAGSDVSVTTGMTVKDKTGAAIGEVSDVKSDGGKTTATIKMGADTFAVETNRLAVANGAATINATQAEIKSMLKK
jgi:hypothetical protein